jgi:predicted dehydrogenase
LKTRREFVAGAAAGILAGSLASRRVMRGQSANDTVVLALIGAGGRGTQLAGNFAQIPNVQFKYVCDVNDQRGGEAIKELTERQGYAPQRIVDMRRAFDDKDVHAVVIATPEHWHALAMIWACQAGKDVYVEKPISLCIWEGQKMVEAARKYKRVVQCGLENRSAPYAVTARDYFQSGKLGRVELIKAYNLLPNDGPYQQPADASAPAGVDWDRFVGPAPKVPFNPGRLKHWANYWAYGGGSLSGDAIHQLDLTRMVLGDPENPKSVYCKGGRFAYDDQREVPDVQAITYDYGNFIMTCDSGSFSKYTAKFNHEVRYGKTWPFWPLSSCRVEIYGTNQMMYLGRHGAGWQVLESDGKVVAEDKGYFPDKWHQPNFIDCVRSRKEPNSTIEQGHISTGLIHLGNIAYRTGNRWLEFDSKKECFAEERANQYLKLPSRREFEVPDKV